VEVFGTKLFSGKLGELLMQKEETRKRTVEEKVKVIYCDCCGKEIPEETRCNTKIEQSVTIRNLGLFYVDYKQGDWKYDCCWNCCKKIKDMFDKEKK
jgi:hypothetical protein